MHGWIVRILVESIMLSHVFTACLAMVLFGLVLVFMRLHISALLCLLGSLRNTSPSILMAFSPILLLCFALWGNTSATAPALALFFDC